MCFFFKQKTAYEMRISDWSSDVCSSDLGQAFPDREVQGDLRRSEDLDGGDGHGSHAAGVVSISGVIAWRSAYYSYIAVSDGSEVSAIEVGVGPAVMTPELREAIHADLQHQIAKAVR